MEKVFIVDDDPDDRQIIMQAFVENHSQVGCLFFENAGQALNKMNTESHELPDLILLDLNMPGLSGLQALKEIRQNKKFAQIPIVVLTTSQLKKDKMSSYELGANCFLTKPDSYSKLIRIVDAIIKLWLFEEPVG
ncbi:MAG TPA: response regulator [Puia sp.]|jgi:CheY-like chemotaxis protein|nr:response regulator [Puia sp.]